MLLNSPQQLMEYERVRGKGCRLGLSVLKNKHQPERGGRKRSQVLPHLLKSAVHQQTFSIATICSLPEMMSCTHLPLLYSPAISVLRQACRLDVLCFCRLR